MDVVVLVRLRLAAGACLVLRSMICAKAHHFRVDVRCLAMEENKLARGVIPC